MRKAFLIYEKSWTGRVSPRIVFDAVQDSIEPGMNTRVGVSQELTGEVLALANSDDPNRVRTIAAMLPPRG
jgi:hypothetical protein